MAKKAQAVLAPEAEQNGHTKSNNYTKQNGFTEQSNIPYISQHRPGGNSNKLLSTDKTTDQSLWRLKDDKGRQTWHYLTPEEAREWPQSFADKYFLNLPLVSIQTSFELDH